MNQKRRHRKNSQCSRRKIERVSQKQREMYVLRRVELVGSRAAQRSYKMMTEK